MKYKYTGLKKNFDNKTLKQIVATKDFGNVKKGEVGGWVEFYSNLDQNDESWIDGQSFVYSNSHICRNSIIQGSCIKNSYVQNAKVRNSDLYDSSIEGENCKLDVFGSIIVNLKVKHNISNVPHPIYVSTLDFEVSYSGFEMNGAKKVHYVSVGCQDHSVENWLDEKYRNKIMRTNGFPKNREEEFLHYLQAIIARHCRK